ncbi:MAG: HEAT repeat domain-containing protein [Candidatus Neptunochlamydia sp.]|nr:HEAT repeat domain-containing protein [Candidatus Neptunochlamydia sp.]
MCLELVTIAKRQGASENKNFEASVDRDKRQLLSCDGYIKRVYSHLLIHDYSSAQKECEESLQVYPDSEGLKKAYIRALSESGKDTEAISYSNNLDNKEQDSDLIETLAWGVIGCFENSSQFIVSIASLMSAYYTDDVRFTEMLLRELNSSNAVLRSMAVKLSPRYRDGRIIDALKRLLVSEKVWFVRLEIIQALGAMEVKEVKEPLKRIIVHSRTTAEEKGAAIASLVNTYDEVGEEELLKLSESKRAGLRHLACQIVAHLDLKEKSFTVEKLLKDPCSDVRVAALNTLNFLGLKTLNPEVLSKIIDLTEDPNPPVSLTAAWIVSRYAPETALQIVRKWVYSTDESTRRLAAFVLGRMSLVGERLGEEVLTITPDPFVKSNLALGAIGQGGDDRRLSDVLYTFLMLRKGKVMWDSSQNPLFEVLTPSKICHIPQVPQYPTMVDHLTRLEILGMLAALKHPQAEEAVKSFLTQDVFGVTYAASITLLEEGGDDAFDILRGLLKEEDKTIRVQAALALALSGGETEAIEILQEDYYLVDREMKINILGALGHIGDKTSIPFLLKILEEPYQTLKVVAASALIQCVYH